MRDSSNDSGGALTVVKSTYSLDGKEQWLQSSNSVLFLSEIALDLAYRCWLENPKRVPEDLFTELMEHSYKLLESYMVSGNWKAADQYTYRIMVQVLDKSVGDFFTPKELLTFPCQDLLRLDDLWVQHSGGKFGFSVQKKIWVQLDGKLDGEWDYETYKRFGMEIAWYDNDFKFIGYKNFKFEITDVTPVGHLPVGSGVSGLHLPVSGS